MSDIGAPQDHHGFTLTNEEYASILALNGRSTPDPLDYWNDLRFTYRTSDAFLDNYLELRLAGYNHEQSVELSHKLDRQFNDRAEAGMLSPRDKEMYYELALWEEMTLARYLSYGAISGQQLADLLKAGGSVDEVSLIQSAIQESFPEISCLDRGSILEEFIELRVCKGNPLSYSESESHIRRKLSE